MTRRNAIVLFVGVLLWALIVSAAEIAGHPEPVDEWVVFRERGVIALRAEERALPAIAGEVLHDIPLFNAYVLRATPSQAAALQTAPGISRIVRNATFTVGVPALTQAIDQGVPSFTTQADASLRVTPSLDLGAMRFGTVSQGSIRITNVGTSVLNDIAITLSIVAAPEGVSLTTGEPGADEFRIEFWDPDSGWRPWDGTSALPLGLSLRVAEQTSIPVRITLGRPNKAGPYDIAQTVTATSGGWPGPAGLAPVPWHVARVGAPEAWATTQGENIRVAVLDTGIDDRWPELEVAGGCSAVGAGGHCSESHSWADDHFHGTAVASVIAAQASGGAIGLTGVAPKVDLYAVKVCDNTGTCQFDDILAGLAWAIENDMEVVNMSFGTTEVNPGIALCEAFEDLDLDGMVLVASSGNTLAMSYPAGCPEVIPVGAIDADDNLYSGSGRGPEMAVRGVVAPGQEIFVLSIYPLAGVATGTSFAAPVVAGGAALLLTMVDDAQEVRSILRAGATNLGLPANQQGAGLIDIPASLAAAQ